MHRLAAPCICTTLLSCPISTPTHAFWLLRGGISNTAAPSPRVRPFQHTAQYTWQQHLQTHSIFSHLMMRCSTMLHVAQQTKTSTCCLRVLTDLMKLVDLARYTTTIRHKTTTAVFSQYTAYALPAVACRMSIRPSNIPSTCSCGSTIPHHYLLSTPATSVIGLCLANDGWKHIQILQDLLSSLLMWRIAPLPYPPLGHHSADSLRLAENGGRHVQNPHREACPKSAQLPDAARHIASVTHHTAPLFTRSVHSLCLASRGRGHVQIPQDLLELADVACKEVGVVARVHSVADDHHLLASGGVQVDEEVDV